MAGAVMPAERAASGRSRDEFRGRRAFRRSHRTRGCCERVVCEHVPRIGPCACALVQARERIDERIIAAPMTEDRKRRVAALWQIG